MTSKQSFKKCIDIVRRFQPHAADWEIRFWEVKEKLIKSMKKAMKKHA